MAVGGTNYRGGLIFTNQGRGADIPSNIAIVNAYPPYNSTSESFQTDGTISSV